MTLDSNAAALYFSRTKPGKLTPTKIQFSAVKDTQMHRQMRDKTVRPCNCYIVTSPLLVARYLIEVNHTRHTSQEGNTMNNRINYSGFVGTYFNNKDEPNPDLREWPVVRSDQPTAPQLNRPHLINKTATEE